ncbi:MULTISPECIES: lytic murein transglycosylase [Chelatococcus]|uniref:Lytic murein transglycosylase n=1 Tax=Chelatococcus caeni TaxID=1348468 RepID=A0A840BXF8_9HYPH|nr:MULTISPECIES: lytic murein transglycosylase [Chelatococcus]ALA16455.1 lytic transglycosylase [Chelatococcus sp. CO-6]MBB4018035.1 lytic murein transglycosylase [Chelatococcus caeni]
MPQAFRGVSRQVQAAAIAAVSVFGLALAGAAPAQAQSCGRDGSGFSAWLAAFRQQAVAQGIPAEVVAAGLDDVSYDRAIISRDRGQGVFQQSFLQFAGRMVADYRLKTGANRIRQQAGLFSAIERQYGVPAEPIVAFWGLETDFGANTGKDPTLKALATLAYDCRRPELFRGELMDALRIVARGDLRPSEMRGAWAGELGQMQFMPSFYYKYGVDADGDGRVDLLRSTPDALASAANFMSSLGWRRGEPWLVEVRVPASLPWHEADLEIRHSASQWASWGVTPRAGALPPGNASLLLPMGRNGPAFLAYDNFRVFLRWNQSFVYATTAAYFAARLAGAPAVARGNGEVAMLGAKEIARLQRLLAQRGYDPGPIDGKLGAATRAAVKKAQMEFGLPADSFPTAELIARLGGG